MYAVIKTGGKQYKVVAGERLKIETLTAEVGATVSFDEVLMIGEGEQITVGAPLISGAPTVICSPSPIISTSSNDTVAPTSAVRVSILRRSPATTLYCLPPVLITAYIVGPPCYG